MGDKAEATIDSLKVRRARYKGKVTLHGRLLEPLLAKPFWLTEGCRPRIVLPRWRISARNTTHLCLSLKKHTQRLLKDLRTKLKQMERRLLWRRSLKVENIATRLRQRCMKFSRRERPSNSRLKLSMTHNTTQQSLKSSWSMRLLSETLSSRGTTPRLLWTLSVR